MSVAHYVSVGICEGVVTTYTVGSAETAYRLAGSIPAPRLITRMAGERINSPADMDEELGGFSCCRNIQRSQVRILPHPNIGV